MPNERDGFSFWSDGTIRVSCSNVPMISSARSLFFAVGLGLSSLAIAPTVSAFCGFYVAGADTKLVNNATMVVLMREGTRTVLSMQNNDQGPPESPRPKELIGSAINSTVSQQKAE